MFIGHKFLMKRSFGKVDFKIIKNGIHQTRSLKIIFNPNFNGNSPLISAIENPIGPKIFPRKPTNTIGQ